MIHRWAFRQTPLLPTSLAVLMLSVGLCASAFAQTPPDVGSLLRQQPKPPPVTSPTVKPPVAASAPQAPSDVGPRVQIRAVRIVGAKLIPAAQLEALMQPLIGGERSLGQLRAAALVLVGAYAQHGYLAQAFLPPQELKDGVVEYHIVEGKRGKVIVTASGARLDPVRVAAYVEHALAAGAALDLRALGEGMNLLNEQPGVTARVALTPGIGEGDVDLEIRATELPLFRSDVAFDNSGSRGTGELTATSTLTLSNLSGRFDSASLLASATQGTQFVWGGYNLALNPFGLRVGVSASGLHYRLVSPRFEALGGRGTASTWGLNASQPLTSRDDFNLALSAQFEQRHLRDLTVAGEVSRRVVSEGQLGIHGQRLQPGLGALAFGANLVVGSTDQRNADALAADQASRQVQGHFTKQTWFATLQSAINANWYISAGLRGQTTQHNLDSSERFSLGGPDGVHAYPVAEAQGDAGWLLGIELRKQLAEDLSLLALLDAGWIQVNYRQPATGVPSATPNRYHLASGGLGLNWRLNARTQLRTVLAAPIGSNPGQDANGNDSDGRHPGVRLWANLQVQF